MGIAFILLGLFAAGVVVDLVVGNGLSGDPTHVSLFSGSFTFSESQLVIGAALLGAVSVFLVILGIGFLRGSWGRRRALKHRIKELDAEITALRARAYLAATVQPPQAVSPGEPDVIFLGEAEEEREGAHAPPLSPARSEPRTR